MGFPQPARPDYCGKRSVDPRPFGSTIRDSGYLAVFTSAWVAGLIKPVQSPDAVLETRLWANHGVRVYANQRLSLDEEGKAYGRKPRL
jgi:hypothetical protein